MVKKTATNNKTTSTGAELLLARLKILHAPACVVFRFIMRNQKGSPSALFATSAFGFTSSIVSINLTSSRGS